MLWNNKLILTHLKYVYHVVLPKTICNTNSDHPVYVDIYTYICLQYTVDIIPIYVYTDM